MEREPRNRENGTAERARDRGEMDPDWERKRERVEKVRFPKKAGYKKSRKGRGEGGKHKQGREEREREREIREGGTDVDMSVTERLR